MIEAALLRELGWSDDLIKAVTRVRSQPIARQVHNSYRRHSDATEGTVPIPACNVFPDAVIRQHGREIRKVVSVRHAKHESRIGK